jgi:glycine oxidase
MGTTLHEMIANLKTGWAVAGKISLLISICMRCVCNRVARVQMEIMQSVVVLGAGLMGRLLACQLARSGYSVQLFDAGGAGAENSAARAAAAMLAPLAESAVSEAPVVRMGMYSLRRWPELLAQLPTEVYFQQAGSLVLWHRQDAAEAAVFNRQLHTTCQTIAGLPQPQALDAKGLAALEPSLAQRFNQGVYLPQEGQLDNLQLLHALHQQLCMSGVQMRWHSPRAPHDFSPGSGAPGQPDWVLDCRGTGARAEWGSVRGVRGEIITVHAPEVQLLRPIRLMHPRYPLYIAPKQNSIFLIGATQIESDDRSAMSVRSALELLSAAYSVHSGFAEARIQHLVSQCRPALPDNLPSVRSLGARTLQINGLYRHGYLIAPAMLDVVIQIMQTQHSPLAATFMLNLDPMCAE